MAQPQGAQIAAWIDHTLLKPDATAEQIGALCREARQYGFASVCINPAYVPQAADALRDSKVLVCTVIGFPLGATFPGVKAEEARACLNAGARELDMVINIGALKSGMARLTYEDIRAVVEQAEKFGAQVKVIIETALLTRREKILACLLSQAAGADFVKTSTGFAAVGATVEDVDLMRRVVGETTGVKAAGGIRTLTDARAMIAAGANRIGASASVRILQELEG
ncbi:MAG: deoxyribose-phosphate aldolase [Chloroflexi bacterium]|nr:deoxyribose-phosphate aldolase [Chloroflexota bacterium]